VRRQPPAMVVTDLREPLVAVHRRMIRTRTVLMAIWIVGWASTGFVSETAWLAIGILVATGPALWIAAWIHQRQRRPGRRTPVGPRALTAPGAPGAGAGR
jgi:hypothetical protein